MKLLLIDGTNIAYRWFSNPEKMLDYFHSTVISLARSFDTEAVLVSFDNKGSSFRKELNPEYKAHRSQNLTDEQVDTKAFFYDTVKKVPRILADHDIPCVSLQHVETDDIIAWVCKHYHNQCNEITIISSDKDLYQLLQYPGVKIYALTQQKEMTREIFEETYGIPPEHWAYVKALAGDVSDNIKGIHLVGEKRAIDYVKTYGPSIAEIYEKLPKIKKKLGKIDQGLLAGRDVVDTNLVLVDLVAMCDEILSKYDDYTDFIEMFLEREGFNIANNTES